MEIMKSLFVLLLLVGVSAQAKVGTLAAGNATSLAGAKVKTADIRETFNGSGDVAGKVKH